MGSTGRRMIDLPVDNCLIDELLTGYIKFIDAVCKLHNESVNDSPPPPMCLF